MSNKLVLGDVFHSLNKTINNAKKHWGAYAKNKKELDNIVALECKKQKFQVGELPANFGFFWYCSNRKRNPDNIAANAKSIFDGMQKAGVIENDGWSQVKSIHHEFILDKDNPRVEIVVS